VDAKKTMMRLLRNPVPRSWQNQPSPQPNPREWRSSLAKELLERAKAGQEFDALVQEYTDDQHPGIYRMSNTEVPPDPSVQEYSRERMVKAFGDVSFSLEVGEIGMASYDPAASKYGWHIIKRLR
jgi:parvulin-like peptidyl-prolyl isomerase